MSTTQTHKEALSVEDTLKLALEALERCGSESYTLERDAITAIKKALALAKQEQRSDSEQLSAQHVGEPVAWMDDEEIRVVTSKQKAGMRESLQKSFPKPLYTTPQQRTWVNATTWRGLTNDEVAYLVRNYKDVPATLVVETEAKLKEKNTRNGGCL